MFHFYLTGSINLSFVLRLGDCTQPEIMETFSSAFSPLEFIFVSRVEGPLPTWFVA